MTIVDISLFQLGFRHKATLVAWQAHAAANKTLTQASYSKLAKNSKGEMFYYVFSSIFTSTTAQPTTLLTDTKKIDAILI